MSYNTGYNKFWIWKEFLICQLHLVSITQESFCCSYISDFDEQFIHKCLNRICFANFYLLLLLFYLQNRCPFSINHVSYTFYRHILDGDSNFERYVFTTIWMIRCDLELHNEISFNRVDVNIWVHKLSSLRVGLASFQSAVNASKLNDFQSDTFDVPSGTYTTRNSFGFGVFVVY